MVSPALATMLRDGRETLNARFQHARHRYPDLDAATFRHFLDTLLDPLAVSVAEAFPGAAPGFLFAAYDAGLELCGQRLIGPSSRCPAMNTAWRELLPAAMPLVVRDPVRVLAAVGNATYGLATTPGARPSEWLVAMKHAVPACPDPDTWLRAGQVLAWRCGMSHYRAGALALADSLPESLVLQILQVKDSDWAGLRATLLRDPWWQPGRKQPLKEVARVGGFTGFGGPFRALPRVGALGSQLFVVSGEDCWLLVADRYGSTLHRATAEEQAALRPSATPGLDTRGNRVRLQGHELAIADVGSISSHVMNEHTLLLCSPDTYQVIVVALARPGS
jgi:hypothetical protein